MANEDMEPADCFTGLGLGDQDGVPFIAFDSFESFQDLRFC